MAKTLAGIDIKNNPKRNGFDLSSRNLFTAKVGELLPVWYTFTMPGDKFRINLDSFTRTIPVNSAAFTRVREYYDFFYIPFRLFWKNAPAVLTQIKSNPQTAQSPISPVDVSDAVPHTRLSDLDRALKALIGKKNNFGFFRNPLSGKLLDYLGYGKCQKFHSSDSVDSLTLRYNVDLDVNLFPLLAYNKIYYDFYRFTQWEDNQPYNYNVDYLGGDTYFPLPDKGHLYWNDVTMFDLKYCNHNRDLLTGLLPNQQLGDIAEVDIHIPIEQLSIQTSSNFTLGGKKTNIEAVTGQLKNYDTDQLADGILNVTSTSRYQTTAAMSDNVKGQFNILALRMGQALQKFREISQTGSLDYRSQTEKHFGVKLPSVLSGLCEYLGGFSNNIVINEVVNQTFLDETGSMSSANIKGKGISSRSNGNTVEWEAKEHGIIMCIYHALPIIDYVLTGQNKLLQQVNATSFPIPEFDSLGMEAVTANEFFNAFRDNDDSNWSKTKLGYASRYYQYKTDIDKVHGEFAESLSYWTTPFTQDYFDEYLSTSNYSYSIVKVNPKLMNPIFIAQADEFTSSDTFLCSADFDVKVVRNLDYNGLPY